jgi:hypothetical protein
MSTSADASGLPGTDEFILRCERVRARNYALRAESQAALSPPVEAAGVASFGGALAWFAGKRTRVNLLDASSLAQLPAIEAWFGAQGLTPEFDVLPIVACRPVVQALGERGYRLVAWQPLLHRSLSQAIEAPRGAVDIEERPAEDSVFLDTFMHGYEIPHVDHAGGARIMQARWRIEGARCFLARIGGKPVAAATLVEIDGIARLANAATLPESRGLGAQSALIRTRLRAAAHAGLSLATADARQGGGSLRNLARAGFTVCAQITQWRKLG